MLDFLKPYYVDRRGKSARFTWGEISWRSHGPSLTLHCYEKGWNLLSFGLILCSIHVHVRPWVVLNPWEGGYGFSCTEDGILLYWGKKDHSMWWWPWRMEMRFHHVWAKGAWLLVEDSLNRKYRGMAGWEIREKLYQQADVMQLPYTYINRGEIYTSTASFRLERREYRWRCLQWCPWPRSMWQCIDIAFDPPIRGVCGTSFTQLPGETPEQTLRRMEMTYNFK